MTAERVLELLDALGSSGVKAWIDGGWGVDALVRRQSRAHDVLLLHRELGVPLPFVYELFAR